MNGFFLLLLAVAPFGYYQWLLAAALPRLFHGLVAGSGRAVFFFDLSPIVLRLFFVLKTEYNRRTIEEQTANNTARTQGAEMEVWDRGSGREKRKKCLWGERKFVDTNNFRIFAF